MHDLFRRDRLWQERRRKGVGPQPAPAALKLPAPSLALPQPGSPPRNSPGATSATAGR
jgi:hypothetical protein